MTPAIDIRGTYGIFRVKQSRVNVESLASLLARDERLSVFTAIRPRSDRSRVVLVRYAEYKRVLADVDEALLI